MGVLGGKPPRQLVCGRHSLRSLPQAPPLPTRLRSLLAANAVSTAQLIGVFSPSVATGLGSNLTRRSCPTHHRRLEVSAAVAGKNLRLIHLKRSCPSQTGTADAKPPTSAPVRWELPKPEVSTLPAAQISVPIRWLSSLKPTYPAQSRHDLPG